MEKESSESNQIDRFIIKYTDGSEKVIEKGFAIEMVELDTGYEFGIAFIKVDENNFTSLKTEIALLMDHFSEEFERRYDSKGTWKTVKILN